MAPRLRLPSNVRAKRSTVVFVNVRPDWIGLHHEFGKAGCQSHRRNAVRVSKWLSMLKEIAPRTERVAVLANPKSSPFDYFLSAAQAGAASLALEILPSPSEFSCRH